MNNPHKRIYELKDRIYELEEELARLKKYKTIENMDVIGGDVYTRRKEVRCGSDAEIKKVEDELIKAKEELKKLEKYVSPEEQEKRRIESENYKKQLKAKEEEEAKRKKLKKEQEKLDRKDAFKRVKAAYKSKGRAKERLINKITLSAPKWRNVNKYSLEELEYLIKMFDGNTLVQKKRNKSVRNYNSHDYKVTDDRNWNDFVNSLTHRHVLKSNMEFEETLRGRRI